MHKQSKLQIIAFILLLAADQLSKWWIEQQYPFFHMSVIDGFFNLVRAHNYGVAFSMFADWDHAWRTNGLLVVTSLIAVAVAVWWWKEQAKKSFDSWLLMLILVGAAGNIWDRLTLGYVVDFVDWYIVWDGQAYHWPAFNVADACISVAVVLLLLRSLKKE
ncbi:MAG TPA: signal peptidase II [Mariprofundaceae bacterium]|nr:signal peptidase II [Mariprofundaceae bacterium]